MTRKRKKEAKADPWLKDHKPPAASQALRCNVTSRDPAEEAKQLAAFTLRPSVRAGVTITRWRAGLFKDAGINEVVEVLSEQGRKAASGDLGSLESMLAIQSHTLDTMFNEFAVLAQRNLQTNFAAAETFMRLALKAQSQCRATVESLAVVKNPPAVAFVKQANIAAGHQQVNNGDDRARGNQFPANELLGAHEQQQRLEHGTAQETGFGYPKVATLEPIHRAKNRAGKADIEPQQLQARREIA